MNRRRGLDLVAGSEGFALKDWERAFSKVEARIPELAAGGTPLRALYRECVVQARLLQLAELENLARSGVGKASR